MRHRLLVPFGIVALATAIAVWMPVPVVAQGQSKSTAATPNAASGGTATTAMVWDPTAPPPTGWTPPRTPWGDPDLQGYYLNTSYTPLERPAALKDKALYTKEEAIAAF